jgi:hypothetical protein
MSLFTDTGTRTMTPQITTHYTDGRPSETRDMTPEEIAQIPTEPLFSELENEPETPAPTEP